MNSDLLVVSNNPDVWKKCGPACVKVQGPAANVLYKCIDLLTEGYGLYTHPIAGNARLLHNPFRTVIMRKGPGREQDAATLDRSLQKLEAISGTVPPETRADYQMLDYELFLAMAPGEVSL